jgi:hypothetical protein
MVIIFSGNSLLLVEYGVRDEKIVSERPPLKHVGFPLAISPLSL